MAVTNTLSDQLQAERVDVRDKGGKMRFLRFSVTQSGVGDDGSTLDLVDLPTGPVGARVFPNYSRVTCPAIVGGTLTIGHRKYQATFTDQDTVAENLSAFGSIDVGSGVDAVPFSTDLKFDMDGIASIRLAAQVTGAAIPDGAVIEGYVAYCVE